MISESLLYQRSEQPSEEEHRGVAWLVDLKGEMGQWLLWMGSLVPQIQAPHAVRGLVYICVDSDAGKPSQIGLYGFGACHSAALILDFSCTM